MAVLPTNPQQLWDQAALACAHSRRLREQLACVAEQVAEIEEQCAAIHDAMAAHAGPVVGAAERAARARWIAAGERAIAREYRLGGTSAQPAARGPSIMSDGAMPTT